MTDREKERKCLKTETKKGRDMEERQRKGGRERGRDSRAYRNTTDNSEDWGHIWEREQVFCRGRWGLLAGTGMHFAKAGRPELSLPAVFSREPF